MFNKAIYKCAIFHSYVSLPEGMEPNHRIRIQWIWTNWANRKVAFFSHVVVSINGGTPKSSSVFIEFSLINHSFLGIPHLWNPLRIQLQWTLYTCFITISPWYSHDIPIIAIWHYIPFQKLQPYIYIYIMSIIKLIYCHYITIYI